MPSPFQFGLSEAQAIALMRTQLRAFAFKLWRKRMQGRSTKYVALRSPEVARHRPRHRVLARIRSPQDYVVRLPFPVYAVRTSQIRPPPILNVSPHEKSMERTIVRMLIEELEAEVNNGGFDQFFFNFAGNRTAETIEALKVIGAFKTAEIVTRAAN